jgi:Leu/Phe-tRNA-protein transferase
MFQTKSDVSKTALVYLDLKSMGSIKMRRDDFSDVVEDALRI